MATTNYMETRLALICTLTFPQEVLFSYLVILLSLTANVMDYGDKAKTLYLVYKNIFFFSYVKQDNLHVNKLHTLLFPYALQYPI